MSAKKVNGEKRQTEEGGREREREGGGGEGSNFFLVCCGVKTKFILIRFLTDKEIKKDRKQYMQTEKRQTGEQAEIDRERERDRQRERERERER